MIRLLLGAILLASAPASAKVFQAEYISFEVPDNWVCQQAAPNWICEPTAAGEQKFAIITVTSKEAGPLDQVPQFVTHLSKPRTHQMGTAKPMTSQVVSSARVKLKGQEWAQSLHLSSEVNNFMTMYLATVQKPLAVMVTMSAEKSKWDSLAPIFDRVMHSIQLPQVQIKGGQVVAAGGGAGVDANAGASLGENSPLEMEAAQSGLKFPTIYLVGLALAGLTLLAALYLFLKK